MMNHVKTTHQQECLSRFSGDWKKINFADSAKLKARIGWQGLRTSEYLQSGYAYLITGTDFYNGRIKWDTCHFVNEERYKQDLNIQIKKYDILLTKDGTIGKVAYIDPVPGPTTLNSGVFVIRPVNAGSFVPNFVYHVLNSFLFENFLAKLAAGSTINHLYQKDFVDFSFKAPSELVEQLAIADALSDVDSLIGSLQKLIEKKKAIKLGTMQELLTGRKRLPGFSGKWRIRKVGDLCSIVTKQTGFDYTSIIKPNLIGSPQTNTLPMIQTKNFEGRKFNFSTDYYIPVNIASEFDKIVLDNVCLLFSIVGASVGNLGLFPKGKVAFCGGAIGIVKFYHEIDAVYAFYYFLSEAGQQQIRNVTKGGAQATVTIEDIREFTMPYPELKERIQIAQVLSDMDSEIEQLEKKLLKYQQIKQGMMQELLTGRIRLIADGAANCEMAQDKGIGAGV